MWANCSPLKMNKHVSTLLMTPNLILTIDKEGAPVPVLHQGKVKFTKQMHSLLFISKVVYFIMVCSIHHLDNQLLGKAVPIKESQDKAQKSILRVRHPNQIKETLLRLPNI